MYVCVYIYTRYNAWARGWLRNQICFYFCERGVIEVLSEISMARSGIQSVLGCVSSKIFFIKPIVYISEREILFERQLIVIYGTVLTY